MEANSPVVLLDGGFSSQLSYHVNTDAEYANHPLWCARYLVTDPESVIKTHRDYIKAGADIITTNTYQASIEGFNKYLQLSSHESYHLIKRAVQLAREAIIQENVNQTAKKKVLVAGSIGSYGACLHDGSEYHGNYAKNVSRDVLKNWHRPRMSALVESGVDFLAIETIPALIEAEIILELLHEFPNQKAWISFTCENGHTTVAHDRIGYAANKLWSTSENQLVAIGVNCLKPSFVTPLLNAIREANSVQESSLTPSTRIPTIAYPNSGENYDITEQRWIKFPGSRTIHNYTKDWLNSGLSIIGGCCRTTAKDVILLRNQIQSFNEAIEAKMRNQIRIREMSTNILQL